MDTLDHLKRLIAHDTSSHKSNVPLIQDIRDFAQTQGIEVLEATDNTGQKRAIWLSIVPLGWLSSADNARCGLVLSGHSDTVPAGSNWRYTPFCATLEGNRVYGRGAVDMKGFLASAMHVLTYAKDRLDALRAPLYLCISFDEEVGCTGVKDILARALKAGHRPKYALIGEPTGLQALTAGKGILVYRVRVFGQHGHSSRFDPHGPSAIYRLMQLIDALKTIATQLRTQEDRRFATAFATLSVNQIKAGCAMNVTPSDASFVFDFRPLPDTPKDILVPFFDLCAKLQAQVETLAEVPVCPPTPKPWQDILTQLGAPLGPGASFASEAGHFADCGMMTAILGAGDIARAHLPDEYITLKELADQDAYLRALVDAVCIQSADNALL